MTEHEKTYANELLSFLNGNQGVESLEFAPDRINSRNAAKALEAIVCHRLFIESALRPTHKRNSTYAWKDGIFNCRNIADRGYLWTNVRRSVAGELHELARRNPVAYLMAFSQPSESTMGVWVIPESIVHESLASLPLKKDGQGYVIQIFPDKQRIEHFDASPDLSPFFKVQALSRQELAILDASREADRLAKRKRAEQPPDNGANGDSALSKDTAELLATAAKNLTDEEAFDPTGISDARERILTAIVRRRGQPAFRRRLLAAYKGRCAISECRVESVLDAAHIVPYRGTATNRTGNGLLLRTDLHTLFDLRLIAVDVATMSLLVSPSLIGTGYEEYGGRPLNVPDDPRIGPSRAALNQHRIESGL